MIKSLLFVPAKKKMLEKIDIFNADAYVIDLEDSIEKDQKEEALKTVEFFLKNRSKYRHIFVRINRERLNAEIQCLDKFQNLGFMIPKFENVNCFGIEQISVFKQHPIIALVESPKGMVNIEAIVNCDWVEAVAFGAEDYTASANMDNVYENLYFVKSRLIMYAKAYGKRVYDTPSFEVDNFELLEKDIKSAVSMGFDGKLAISPRHIEIINSYFNNHDLDNIKKIIQIYEESGQAVLKLDGKIYEKMHIDRMRRILKENEEC